MISYVQSTITRRRTLVVLLTTLVLALGSYSMVRCHDKIGDPFLGFFYGQNLLVTAGQRDGWPGVKAGVRPMDRVVRVDGERFTSGATLAEYLWTLRRQNPAAPHQVKVELRRDNQSYSVTYPLPQYTLSDFLVVFVAPCTLGALFLLMGTVVFFFRPRYRVSLVYFFFCVLTSLACMIHFEAFSGFELHRLVSLNSVIAATALHLFTLFPERLKRPWLRRFVVINYCAVLALLALKQAYYNKPEVSKLLGTIDAGYLTLTILASFAVLIWRYFKSSSQAAHEKGKILLLGLTIGTPLLLIWSIGYIFSRRIFYLDQAMLLFLLFPIFLGYATLKKNILDIDRVIRTGISYGLLGGALLLVYLFVVGLVGRLFPESPNLTSPPLFLGVAMALLGAVLITRSVGMVQTYLMRHVFKGRYNLITTLKDITAKLSRASRFEEIQRIMVDDLVERLHLSGAALLSLSSSELFDLEKVIGMQATDIRALPKHALAARLPAGTHVRTVAELHEQKLIEGDTLRLLRYNSVKIIIKIDVKGSPTALLLLGERKRDKELTGETLDILATIANQASISLENARLYISDSERERFAALGKVASIIIHEIKNPLGIIRVSGETIRKRHPGDAASTELSEIIVDEVTRMDSTIQKFLSFAKPDSLILAQCDPDSLAEDVVRKIQPDFQQQGIKLTADLAGNGGPLFADEEKLRRILYNLLLNAKEAAQEGQASEIILQTRVEAGKYLFSVADNGQGMDDTTLTRIFQPFFTTKRGGTGLGLAIVKQIVHEHRGEIRVTSHLGKGAKFEVRLPLLTAPALLD